jgi:hypothetical protein
MAGRECMIGQGEKIKANRNLRRFVEAHVVGVSLWGKGQRAKTLEG